MPPSLTLAGRMALVAGLIALALAACGRRGPLEPPPEPTVQAPRARAGGAPPPGAASSQITLQSQGATAGQDTSDSSEEEQAAANPVLPVVPTPPTRAPRRGYVVPKEPFILDPLL